MTKVEEVARALCRTWLLKAGRDILRQGAPIDPVAMAGATYSGVDKHWRDFIEDAEAAILAMRKPSDEMVKAGDIEAAAAFERNGRALTEKLWDMMIVAAVSGAAAIDAADKGQRA